MAKYLITGGAGFIGSHLAEFLLEKDEEVVIIDNFSTGKMQNISNFINKIKLYTADIRTVENVEELLADIDIVIHLAAIPSVVQSIENPYTVSNNNILGTVNFFDAIAKKSNVKKIVQASSSAIYGDTENIAILENSEYNPLSPYAIDKVAQELYGNFYSNLYNIDIVSLRFFNVYGKRQDVKSAYAGVIPIFIDKAKKGESLIVYGEGNAIRDFISVKDIAKAIYLASKSNVKGHKKINLGTGIGTSVKTLAEMVNKLCENNSGIIYKEKRLGEIDYSLANIGQGSKLIEFTPEINLKQGLIDLI